MNKVKIEMVALFGCGIYIKKYISILDFVQIKIIVIADNEENKIGGNIDGIPIVSPKYLLDIDCPIVISCPYISEITNQLDGMGIKKRIKGLREIITDSCFYFEPTINKRHTVGIDLFSKAQWGGAETWACRVAQALSNSGEQITVFASPDVRIPRYLNVQVIRFTREDSVVYMFREVKKYCPLIYINSFSEDIHVAVLVLKAICPDLVKIIDIVHNDSKFTYGRHYLFHDFVDMFICVSSKIKKTMIKEYLLPEEKVVYAGQPIYFDSIYQNEEKEESKYIRLGYASRLEKGQKRADLLITFIKALEETEIDYVLEIAGDGECFAELLYYVESKHLLSKVRLLGHIDIENMTQFWKKQDIYISFSDYEGCSLSMLEAMSYGCVPLVTDVSGVNDYVLHGYNGYICDANDMHSFICAVKELFLDKKSIKKKGKLCQKIIAERCNMEQYIDFLKGVFDDFGGCKYHNASL